jgi:predicted XRE-type DNA-binding protein
LNTTYNSVWDALEDTPEMAEDMKMRSRLMMEIREHIENRQYLPDEAARQLGMTQPRFDDLMTGKINRFTLDDLVVSAVRAGLIVDMRIREAA